MKYQNITVTGAFGYTGKCIIEKLLQTEAKVSTLTNNINSEKVTSSPLVDKIKISAFNFDNPDKLVETLTGTDVLINTYWIRFNHPKFTMAKAFANTKILLDSAKKAGVKKIVHISITNANINSPFEYFQHKGAIENIITDTFESYTILRPTVIFGRNDTLINNIAWGIRYFPIIGVFGDGSYKMQPIHIDDLADLAIEHSQNEQNQIINVNGPETYSYIELVKTIREILAVKRLIIKVPPIIGYIACFLIGKIMNDVMLTYDEVKGLMANTLSCDTPPTGKIKLSEWIVENKEKLGKKYTREVVKRIS